MPKIKTNRSAAKRFCTIGKGFRRSLNYKNPKQNRSIRKNKLIARANLKVIKRLLPNL